MGDELFRKIENRLLRGKALMEHMNSQQNNEAQPQTSLELFMHSEYSFPQEPGVTVERSVWAYRNRGRRLATV